MSEWGPIIEVVFQHEVDPKRGPWVNNPKDPGGETSYGLSRRWLQKVGLGLEDLKAMTQERAEVIFRDYYENPSAPLFKTSVQAIEPQKPATKLYDAAVVMGFHEATYLIQLGLLSCGANLIPDGFFGSQTLRCINAADPQQLVDSYCDHLAAHFKSLVAKNHDFSDFLDGWLERAKWGHSNV
jgi:lysozyme family protein